MSEESRDLTPGGQDSPRDKTNGAAGPANAGNDAAANVAKDSKAKETPVMASSKRSPPTSGSKRPRRAKSKVTVKAATTVWKTGEGTSAAEGGHKSGKVKAAIGLQFSSPSADPPTRRDLKPDPEKVRRARRESQLKTPESAPASRRAAAAAAEATDGADMSDAAAPPDSEQPSGIPSAARLSGAIKPTRPINQRLFRRHRRGLSIAASLLVVSGIVWWSGAFQQRTDLANLPDPTEVTEPAVLETAAAKPNDEEVRRETEKLLADVGLITPSPGGQSEESLRAAIRDYQSMAGLPVDGEPSYDLLIDLRAVANAIATE